MKLLKNRGAILFSIVNSIFIAFQIAGVALSRNPRLDWNAPFCIILFFASVIPGFGLGILVSYLLKVRIDKRQEAVFAQYEDGWLIEGYRTLGDKDSEPLPSASVSWLIILISYIPGFLAYYPGICSYDAYIQIEQIMSGAYNDHHPVLHTRLLELFLKLGESLGNINSGIAFFVAFQLVCLSGSFAYCIYLAKKIHCGKIWHWILTGFGALFPYNVFMGLSVTKAALFTATYLPAMMLMMFFVLKKREELKLDKEDIFYILYLVVAIAFRNNARYAVIAVLAVLFISLIVMIAKRKRDYLLYLRIFITTLTGLVISVLLVFAVGKLWDVTQKDQREMLSIPVQQLARCTVYNVQDIDPEEMEVIDNFILDEAWRNYDPLISDPVKRHVNTWFAVNFPKQTIHTYLKLLIDYPDEYINAFLAQNAGYLYVGDTSCLWVYGKESDGHGYVQTDWADYMYEVGAYHDSIIPPLYSLLEKMNSQNILQSIPVVGLLFISGHVIWVFIYFGLICWYRKKYSALLPIVMAVMYIATLLLGPTVQLRYIYPVWVFLPFLAAVIFRKKRDNKRA
ncbi:MAG: DUF6020 family protein [Lachnospiraceae bacterium]|nr:DUF6020 family protein [Lachnospiraceae bacterium]